MQQLEIVAHTCLVKPARAVTSIKQSLLLKDHIFLSCHRKSYMNLTTFKKLPVL
jgi:hypothetical protein